MSHNNKKDSWGKKILMGTAAVGTTAVAGFGIFIACRYKVCKPHQFLVKTGYGIKSMEISKHSMIWPFQRGSIINMNPITYEFDLHNMSKEKVEFKLPVVFTIGPVDPADNMDGFNSYAKMMNDMTNDEVRRTIGGMIEGETRGQTAQLTIEEMFSQKDIFRETVVKKIDVDLKHLGMRILNANIKEMSDYDEHNKYFEYRKKRAIETANYEAQVAVAEAKKTGEVGVQQKEGEIRIEKARIEKEAKLEENERNQAIAISDAELDLVQTNAKKKTSIAIIEADMAAKQKKIELEISVQEKRRLEQTESLKADKLSLAIAEAEAMERLADAHLYQEQKKAEGIEAIYSAQANGLQNIVTATGNDTHLSQFYLGLISDLYPQLAREGANAVKGLEPKIHVWNTGNGKDNNNIGEPFLKLFQSFAPAIDGIQNQVKMPDWLPQAKENNTKKQVKIIENNIKKQVEISDQAKENDTKKQVEIQENDTKKQVEISDQAKENDTKSTDQIQKNDTKSSDQIQKNDTKTQMEILDQTKENNTKKQVEILENDTKKQVEIE